MKHISRQESPDSFEKWKARNRSAHWGEFGNEKNHTVEIKREVKEKLLSQQNNLCGYCEVAVQLDDSHIEHLKDRNNYPREMFDYDNFIASCQYTDSCGHYKGTGYFSGIVSPFDNNCEQRFTYTGNGKIIPVDENDSDALNTIEVLGLNCKRLKDRRVSIIKTLELADNDFVSQYLSNCEDWLGGFYTVVKYMQK
ncbi:MAG: TIGR02646 family protein [Marinifilaceae bacterium]|jgi:uncharacterized protein (TIGR02646 family)|nr:TIGR02646 family protein [Marinifilaceae bacterium]